MIVSSLILDDARQADGSRWITERHTDQLGLAYDIRYLADALTDILAAMAARVARLNTWLTEGEIATNIAAVMVDGSLASYALHYSTPAQNFAGLRIAYRDATRTEAIMIGDFLNARTDAQLQSAFNMTPAEVTALRTNKLQPAATAAATIRATMGA